MGKAEEDIPDWKRRMLERQKKDQEKKEEEEAKNRNFGFVPGTTLHSYMSTNHMTPIPASPAGVQPQTSVPPLIQIWQMQKMTLPAIEEQKSLQLNQVGPLCREHQGLQWKRLLQR